VDIIIALGMAMEGFDWVWCEHARTIGYRSSLTQIVQIIGRATRDAPGKRHAQFTNLVAEPGVETGVVTDAVNDMLKAISGALLMEQVLQPNFKFYRREDGDTRPPVEVDDEGRVHIGIGGLMLPPTARAREIVENDMHELVAKACQQIDRRTVADDVAPEVATQMVLTDIIEKSYENLTPDETESIRQDLAARMNIAAIARKMALEETEAGDESDTPGGKATGPEEKDAPDALNLIRMVKKCINVRELDIDLIDSINPFGEAYKILAKEMNEDRLKQVEAIITGKKVQMTPEEARDLARRAVKFKAERNRLPSLTSPDPWERRMAEGVAFLARMKAEANNG